jgi:hypothetical protein
MISNSRESYRLLGSALSAQKISPDHTLLPQ